VFHEFVKQSVYSISSDPRMKLKGDLFFKMGHFGESMRFLDRALQLDPKLPEAWHTKAVLLGTLKQYSESLVCAQKALELNPLNSQFWCTKGQ
jgi:tetratricopeptide (TPR) repeat protein